MLIICLLVCLSTPRASWHILVVPKTMPSSSSPFSSSTPLSSVPNNAKEETTTGTYPKDGCPPRITSGAKRSEYQSWGVWASRQASQGPVKYYYLIYNLHSSISHCLQNALSSICGFACQGSLIGFGYHVSFVSFSRIVLHLPFNLLLVCFSWHCQFGRSQAHCPKE